MFVARDLSLTIIAVCVCFIVTLLFDFVKFVLLFYRYLIFNVILVLLLLFVVSLIFNLLLAFDFLL